MIAATITRSELAAARPGIRFGLIDQALAPLEDTLGVTDSKRLVQLKIDLSAVVSAEAFFSLADLAGVPPDEAIASLVRTAMTITSAAVSRPSAPTRLARRTSGAATASGRNHPKSG